MPPEVGGIIKIGCPLRQWAGQREAYGPGNVCQIHVPIMMMPKYMLNQCCDYVDVKLI